MIKIYKLYVEDSYPSTKDTFISRQIETCFQMYWNKNLFLLGLR